MLKLASGSGFGFTMQVDCWNTGLMISMSIMAAVTPLDFMPSDFNTAFLPTRAARRTRIYGLRLPYVGYGYRTVSLLAG